MGPTRVSLRIRKRRALEERRERILEAQRARKLAVEAEERERVYYAPGNPGFECWKRLFEADFCSFQRHA